MWHLHQARPGYHQADFGELRIMKRRNSRDLPSPRHINHSPGHAMGLGDMLDSGGPRPVTATTGMQHRCQNHHRPTKMDTLEILTSGGRPSPARPPAHAILTTLRHPDPTKPRRTPVHKTPPHSHGRIQPTPEKWMPPCPDRRASCQNHIG